MPPPRDDFDDRPRPRRRRHEDDEDDFDDDYDRPRRRPRGDETGGLIPYKNGYALAAYYLGVFGLIPCVGIPLGAAAVVCGVLGLRHRRQYPETAGAAHAWVGIVLGTLELLGHVTFVGTLVVAGFLRG